MTIAMEIKDDKTIESSPKIKPPRKPLSKKQKKIIVIISVVLIVSGVLGFLVYKGYLFSKELGFKFDPSSIISNEKYELKKDSTGRYTNVLLVGLDTRESGNLMNTDTVILASYDHETKNAILLSIPRDFHVEVSPETRWYVRINSIYSRAEGEEEEAGMEALKESVERVSDQEIQYVAMVDLKAFTEVVDAVGGVDVNVENSFTDYMYPLGLGYTTVSFKAGPQTMDGETALQYARSRHSSQNGEGSDFARARRQQKVIIGLKDKILSSETLANPKTLMNIFSSIGGNIKVSEFTISDIEAAFELAEEYKTSGGKVFSFVLDPTVGGYSLVENKQLESGAYAIGPKLGLGKYTDIHEYIGLVRDNPGLYSENPKIRVYDTGLGYQASYDKVLSLKESLPYLEIVFAGTLYSDKEGTYVFPTQGEEYTYSIKALTDELDTENAIKPEYISSNLNGEDVTILLGKEIDLIEE